MEGMAQCPPSESLSPARKKAVQKPQHQLTQKLCTGAPGRSTKQLQAQKSRSRTQWEERLLSQETQPLAEALLGGIHSSSFNWFNLKKNVSAEEAFRGN